jgi:YD repeat-containing protein
VEVVRVAESRVGLFLIVVICVVTPLPSVTQVQAANVSYVYDELNRVIQAIYDDGKIVNYAYDKAGNRFVKDIAVLQETVSTPSKPTGPRNGTAEVSYSYSTGRSSSDLGHPIQYLFDWGDETNSGWLPAGQKGEKAWATSGHYDIKVRARCASHNFILSAWSETLSVDIAPIQIDLQFPSNEAAFNCCSLVTNYQPAFDWASNWAFPQYTILLSTSPTDFTTQGVLIAKATVGINQHWTPTATLWKTILTSSHNKGNIQDIYWKVVGTKADKKTVESPVRSFGIEGPQKVTIVAPSNNAVLPSGVSPSFEFNSNCNTRFTLEISPSGDFSSSIKIRSFAFTTKDPNVEAVVKRTLTSLQWISVKPLIDKGQGYFRIKAWDGLNRETVSETRSFSIQ